MEKVPQPPGVPGCVDEVEWGEVGSGMKNKRTVTFVLRDRKTKKIIHEWDADFVDHANRGFHSLMFKLALMNHYEERLKELFRVDVTTHKPGWVRRTCLTCGRNVCDRQPEDKDPADCKHWKRGK